MKHSPQFARSGKPPRETGKRLAKRWGLTVHQALYRETGDWYHRLNRFPGALLDAGGYVVFETEDAFEACPHLRIGRDPKRHGGWVAASLGISIIPGYVCASDRSLVESLVRARVPANGQGWSGSAAGRKAIELYAMDVAKRHYESLWREVVNVSDCEPFDLLCRNADRELHVEVKGTTSLGFSVLLFGDN